MRLNAKQRAAVLAGSRLYWKSYAQTGTHGTVMDALARRGLAHVERRDRMMVYRLTVQGEELRGRLAG